MASKALLTNLIRNQKNLVNCLRPLSTSRTVHETFTIQDEADFKQKVIDSPIPVIVDFTGLILTLDNLHFVKHFR